MSNARSIRCALAAVWAVGWLLAAAPASAQSDAEAVRRAEAAFDDGSDAYKIGKFELAASHFEAADQAVPSVNALRMSIRARQAAKHGARAATLAAQALERYPDDDKTKQFALTVISAEEDRLHRLDITCSAPCVLAAGERSISGAPREHWIVYVDPGEVSVSASFGKDGSDGRDAQLITATAAGTNRLRFEPRRKSERPASPVVVPPKPSPDRPVTPPPDPAPGDVGDSAPDEAADPSWIESPAVFIVLAVATAGVGGVTIWSGVDTIQDPGTDAVRETCRGQGTSCQAYQDGVAKQTRTNVLIGATGGTALLTLLFGVLVTEWGGGDGGESKDAARLTMLPSLSPLWGPDTAGMSLGGRF